MLPKSTSARSQVTSASPGDADPSSSSARAHQHLYLVAVDGFQQCLPGREMPVQGADPDTGPPGDLLQ